MYGGMGLPTIAYAQRREIKRVSNWVACNSCLIRMYIYVIPKRSKIHHPNVSKVKEVGRNHGGIFSSFCHTFPICLELVLFREKWRKGHTCRCHHFHLLWERKGKERGGGGCCGPSTTTIHTTHLIYIHWVFFSYMPFSMDGLWVKN